MRSREMHFLRIKLMSRVDLITNIRLKQPIGRSVQDIKLISVSIFHPGENFAYPE
jgi:hypothetical protein